MYFFADLKTASQDILEEVGQEAVFKDAEKDAKSELLPLRDRFMTKHLCNEIFFFGRERDHDMPYALHLLLFCLRVVSDVHFICAKM